MSSVQTQLPPESLTATHSAALRRNAIFFAAGLLVLLAVSHSVIASWLHFARNFEHYSHLVLIPFITAYLLFTERQQIFRDARPAIRRGVFLSLAGLGFVAVGFFYRPVLNEEDFLTNAMTGLVTIVIAGFLALWGGKSARTAAFPLGFLFLAVPLPIFVIDTFIEGLQQGSASLSYAMFQLVGTPVLRDGFVFSLPHQTIQVARECSGIRSSLAMMVLVLLCGHWYLQTNVRRIILCPITVPLLIFKNSVRIVTLTLLAEYVDPSFLTGRLHHEGGVVFFGITFALVGLIISLLRRTESPSPKVLHSNRAAAAQPAS